MSFDIKSRFEAILTGAAFCVFGSIPLAGLTALFFRFPVPFAGYVNGLLGVIPAMLGVVFYLILGGFIILGVLGTAVGLITWNLHHGDGPLRVGILVRNCLLADMLPIALLAVWDLIYGPW
jgi:hypothetical protein